MENERRFEPYKGGSFLNAPQCTLEDIPDPATAVGVVGIPTDSIFGLWHKG